MRLWKVTAADGSAMHGGSGRWKPGVWRTAKPPLRPCEHGLHLCRDRDLVRWLGPVIWEAEAEGEVIEQPDKIVAAKARVIRRVEAWNERTARLFAAECAEHVLPLFEAQHPGDDRPRRAIEVARLFADGKATDQARAAVWAAARAAAGAAAGAAARAAAWAAARAAARDAARDAAGAAEHEWQTERLMALLEAR